MIETTPLSRHDRVALSFSGGKDSLACVYLLRDHLDAITIYHMDTGDLLPEMMEIVEHVKGFAPHFVHLRGNITAWIDANGLPSDLVPHSAHPVGRAMGEHGAALLSRYDCCYTNLMEPTYRRILDDGNTLLIRGTKACDMKALPADNGRTAEGVELWMPLREWSHSEVMDYLRSVGAPISRVYDHAVNAPECARCPAWWSEGRAAYLRQYHPALFEDYRARMAIVAHELAAPMGHLHRELTELSR